MSIPSLIMMTSLCMYTRGGLIWTFSFKKFVRDNVPSVYEPVEIYPGSTVKDNMTVATTEDNEGDDTPDQVEEITKLFFVIPSLVLALDILDYLSPLSYHSHSVI